MSPVSLPPPPPLSDRHALLLDLDGTLAPLQDDADAVHLSADQHDRLLHLSERRDGALAVISGRDVRDLASRTPTGLYRVGNHGLYTLRPGKTAVPDLDDMPDDLHANLSRIADGQTGAFLEVKGPVGTIHFRACPDAGPRLIDAVKTVVASQSAYRAKIGHYVVEAIPDGANKGVALSRLMAEAPFSGRVPVMVGDDTTDEDAFLAAQRVGGFGVKVGEGETVARKWLMDVDAVWDWLEASE